MIKFESYYPNAVNQRTNRIPCLLLWCQSAGGNLFHLKNKAVKWESAKIIPFLSWKVTNMTLLRSSSWELAFAMLFLWFEHQEALCNQYWQLACWSTKWYPLLKKLISTSESQLDILDVWVPSSAILMPFSCHSLVDSLNEDMVGINDFSLWTESNQWLSHTCSHTTTRTCFHCDIWLNSEFFRTLP